MKFHPLTSTQSFAQLQKYPHRLSGNTAVRLLREWMFKGNRRISTDVIFVPDHSFSTPGYNQIVYTAFEDDVIVSQSSFDCRHSMGINWMHTKADTPKGSAVYALCLGLAEYYASNVSKIDSAWV